MARMPDGWVITVESDRKGMEVRLRETKELVMCKSCVYFCPNVHDRGDDSRCALWNAETRADDYCSKAERRCNEDFCEIGGE